VSTEYRPSDYLDLFDYRTRVAGQYARRDAALNHCEDPAEVCARFRAERDDLFATHAQSALDAGQRDVFCCLRYFPYRTDLVAEGIVYRRVAPAEIMVDTGERQTPLRRVATVRFALQGEDYSLDLYWIDVYGGGLFLPFRDGTAGAETYGAGRYLMDTVKGSTLRSPGPDRLTLDFNYAYNPSCAYNPRWVCPLAPPDNRMSVPVPAGEMAFTGGDTA